MVKRKSSSRSSRPSKRRRTVRRGRRRRRTGGSARTASWTMQTGTGKGLRPTSRKTSKRAWKRLLWNQTLAYTHWKSSANGSATITTPAAIGSGTVTVIRPTFIGVPGPTTAFWTVAGGLLAKDTGESAPTFIEGNMIIRGGQIGTTFTVLDAVTQEVNVRLWAVWCTPDPTTAVIPATIPYGAQLTSQADFEPRFGKVIDYKEATLNNAYPSFTYVRRMGVQKIDMEIFGTEQGSQVVFVIAVTNMATADAVAVNSLTWHDLSFCADVDA